MPTVLSGHPSGSTSIADGSAKPETGATIEIEKLTPQEASAVVVSAFRTNLETTQTDIQDKINYLSSCKTEALKSALHRSVAEVCEKVIKRYAKSQKLVQNMIDGVEPLSDGDVKKIMAALNSADIELGGVKIWAKKNDVDKSEDGSKRRKKK